MISLGSERVKGSFQNDKVAVRRLHSGTRANVCFASNLRAPVDISITGNREGALTLSFPSSKLYILPTFEKGRSDERELVAYVILFHLSKQCKAKFFILRGVNSGEAAGEI